MKWLNRLVCRHSINIGYYYYKVAIKIPILLISNLRLLRLSILFKVINSDLTHRNVANLECPTWVRL